MIPTVRVANHADPRTFKTINAADYRPLVHGPLWHEQAPGFQGIPAVLPATLPQAERDYAGTLFIEMIELRHQAEGKPEFHNLTAAQRMVVLRDIRTEFERERTRFLASTAAPTGDLFSRSSGAVPGQTPGHPADATTGLGIELTQEQRAALAEIKLDGSATLEGAMAVELLVNARGDLVEPETAGPPPGLPPLGPDEPEEPAAAANVPAAKPQPVAPQETPVAGPSWAKAAPLGLELKAEKGPGGKWYVKHGTSVLSEGFPTKAAAEAEFPNHIS